VQIIGRHRTIRAIVFFGAFTRCRGRLNARSRRTFPCEPIRALDAIHLATALAVRNLSPEVQVLSFDERIRDNAASLGFALAPAAVRQP